MKEASSARVGCTHCLVCLSEVLQILQEPRLRFFGYDKFVKALLRYGYYVALPIAGVGLWGRWGEARGAGLERWKRRDGHFRYERIPTRSLSHAGWRQPTTGLGCGLASRVPLEKGQSSHRCTMQ